MPLNDQQKQFIITQHGLDPSKYAVDESTMQIVPAERQQPSVSTTPYEPNINPVPKIAPPSPLSTGINTFIDRALPALGAGLGAKLGMMAGAPGGPLGSLLGGVGIGMAGAGAVDEIQDALTTDEYKKKLAESQAYNPKAAMLGNILTMPLSGFGPNSFKNLGLAAGGAGKILTGGLAPKAEEMQQLFNVGIGAGLAPAQQIAQSAVSGEPMPSIGSLAGSAALGAWFSKPNMIGRALGFHNPYTPASEPSADMLANAGTRTETTPPPLPEPALSADDIISAGGLPFNKGVNKKNAPSDAMSRWQGDKFPSEIELNRQEGEGGPVRNYPDINPAEDKAFYERQQRIEGFKKGKEEKSNVDFKSALEEAKNAILSNQGKAPEKTVNPLVTTETGRDIMPDYSGVQAADNAEVEKESPQDLINRKAEGLGDKYSEPSVLTEAQKQTKANLEKAGKTGTLTPEWYHFFKDTVGALRNVKMSLDGNIVNKDTGKPVAGQVAMREGINAVAAKINPETAGADTPSHEIAHPFINDLEESPRYQDNQFAAKYHKLVSNLPDYKQWASERQAQGLSSSTEEYIVTNQGMESVNRAISTEGPLRQYFGDLSSYLKTRWSKHATADDFQRIFNYKILHDPAYKGTTEIGAPNTAGVANSEQSNLPKEQQPELFKNLDSIPAFSKMREAIDKPAEAEQYAKQATEIDANTKNAEQSNLISPDHGSLKEMTIKALKAIDNDTMDDRSALQIQQAFQHGVDWSKHPDLKAVLDKTDFESKPQTLNFLKSLNSQFPNKPLEQKPIEVPRTIPPAATEEVKSLNDVELKGQQTNVEQPSSNVPLKKGVDYTPAEKLKPEPKVEINKAPQREPAKIDFSDMRRLAEAVDKTAHPELTQKYIKEAYNNVVAEHDKADVADRPPYRNKMQILKNLAYELDNKYNLTTDLPVHNYSEESALPKLNSRVAELKDRSQEPMPHSLGYATPIWLESQLDKIRKLGPAGEKFASGFEKFVPMKDEYYGRFMAPILETADKLSPEDLKKVEAVGIKESREGKDYSNLLSTKQNTLKDTIRQSLLAEAKDQQAHNQPVTEYAPDGKQTLRQNKIDPFYWPNRVNPQVIEAISKNNNPVVEKFKNDFIQHYISEGKTKEQAEAHWASMEKAYDIGEGDMTKFGAVREAQGVGLPDSMMRHGLLENLSAYANRRSTDRAFHDTFESDPIQARLIGKETDPWGKQLPELPDELKHNILGDDNVKDVLEGMQGSGYDKSEKNIKAINRIATSLMLGPLTNFHIMASSMANVANFMKPSEAPGMYMRALTNLKSGYDKAIYQGKIRPNFDTMGKMLDQNLTSVEKLQNLSGIISKISGRNLTDTFTKSFLQNIGEDIIKARWPAAANGDVQAQALMKRVDPEWSAGKQYSEADIQRLGSNLGSLVHGGHDARTLPGWMLKDTAVQPFFSLMSWNIAQTNSWFRHVLTPAKQGNLTPLIMSTLGAAAGGYIIKAGRELMSDKKSTIPSLTEILNSEKYQREGIGGVAKPIGYNLAAMASYTGYMGMLSTMAKATFDAAYKNIPQGATFPLDELMGNSLHRIHQGVSALMSDPNADFFSVGTKVVTDIAKENIQLARLAMNWASRSPGADNIPGMQNAHYLRELNIRNSDLRRWKQVEDMPYEEQTANEANPYLSQGMKQFKRTEDINEAAQQLPGLVSKAITKSNGNPDILRAELHKLKANTYETVPDPEREPVQFSKYYNFLIKTQGADAASAIIYDYMKKKTINQSKSQMVPSF